MSRGDDDEDRIYVVREVDGGDFLVAVLDILVLAITFLIWLLIRLPYRLFRKWKA